MYTSFWMNLPERTRELVIASAMPLGLVFLFCFGEGVLRWEQYRKFGDAQVVETKSDTKKWETVNKRRRPIPGAKIARVEYSKNGFRGEDLAVEKPSRTVRVGFFGSSTTIDLYVKNDEETWPAVAMRRLEEQYPHCEFEFFNAGVVGYHINATLRRFTEDASAYEPDIAIFLLTDLTRKTNDLFKSEGVKIKPYRPSGFAQLSFLWLKMEKNAEALRLQRLSTRDDYALRIDLEALSNNLERELESFAETMKKYEVLPVFIENATRLRIEHSTEDLADAALSRILYLPGVYIRDIVDGLYIYNYLLQQTSERNNFVWIPTMNAMPSTAEFFVDASHTNRKGSKKYGELIGEQLSKNQRIRETVSKRGGNCIEN